MGLTYYQGLIFNKYIIIMVGNIGSGKSTKVKELMKHGFVQISRDYIRYMLGDGNYVFDSRLESAVFYTEHEIIESLMMKNVNIIVDTVGVCKKFRSRYIELAKAYNYNITAYVMPRLSKEESINRRIKNGHGSQDRKSWEEVWEKFDKMYEEPIIEEGFNKIIKV